MANANCSTTHDVENHRNLTALWRALGASPVPGLEAKGGVLADGWPDRVWLDLGQAPTREDLEAVDRARGDRSVLLPLWGPPSSEVDSLLRAAGYEAALTQTAMSLELGDRAWASSEGVDVVRDPGLLLRWNAAVSAAFGYAFDSAASRRLFGDPRATLFAAKSGGAISGTGVAYATGSTAGVYWVGVPPRFRRRGVARALVHRILAHAAARGHARVTLQASAAGQPLYDALGFVGNTPIRSYRSGAGGRSPRATRS